MITLSEGPIDQAAVEAAVSDPGHGAVLTFAGVARNTFGGRPVRALFYEAWPQMAVREMERVAEEAVARWPTVRVAIVHRVGPVPIGDAAVVIAVGAPHREEAYAASRFSIDTLKARVPIWKKEIYADGEEWIANRP